MRIGLAKVAERAGVSEATVSRVINDKPGVAQATRDAVLRAAAALGYERPATPRQQRAGLVGLVVPELTNPVFPVYVQVIEAALVRANYTPVLGTQSPGGVLEEDYLAMMVDHGVAGIIIVSGLNADTKADQSQYRQLRDRGMPVVFVNGAVPDLDAAFISCDDAESAVVAVNHLVDLGHRRIGLASGPERYIPVIRKRAGFLRAMRDRLGVDATDLVRCSVFTVEGGYAAGHDLLDAGCTAVVCGSDMMALGVIRAARAQGLSVPYEVSVVGYDDSPLVAFTDPPLSTVRQPVREMGVAAVRALLDDIAGTPAQRGELLFQPELVLRASTAPAPVTTV